MERKTRYVFNDEEGSYEEVPVRGFKMTDEDRIGIVRDFLERRMTSEEIVKRYELSSKQLLYNWVVKYMDEGNMLSLFPQITTDMDKDGKERMIVNALTRTHASVSLSRPCVLSVSAARVSAR